MPRLPDQDRKVNVTRNIWLYSIKNLKREQTNFSLDLDFPVRESSAFKYVLKNTKVNLKHYQIKPNKLKKWPFALIERFDYEKIKALRENPGGSGDDVRSRRSTIDFNDLEYDQEEDPEIDQQNPFLLGGDLDQNSNQDESGNGMFLEESLDNIDPGLGGLVVIDQVPQAKIVGVEDGPSKPPDSNDPNSNK